MNNLEIPLVSVIVLNYNGQKHLKECFDSLYELNYNNVELILVDNNSKDNSVEFVKNNYNRVKIIQLKYNYGFAKANNIAATQAKGKYIVLLNNDTYVDINWLTELVKVAESSYKIGIVGSKIYYYDNKKLISYAGSSCDKYGKSNHIGENKTDHRIFNTDRKTFYACGACLLIKRELYQKIGLFDSLYFIYNEDLDLCWRTWIFGYLVMYASKSFIYHKIGQVMGKETLRQKFLGERNILRTVLKNYELKTLFKIFPVYIGRRIGIILRFLVHLDILAIIIIYIYIKAFSWNIIHIKSLIRKRKRIQSYRTKDDRFLIQFMKETIKLETSLRNL